MRKLQSGAEPQEPSSDVKATASLMLELVMVAGFGRVQDWTKDETQAQTKPEQLFAVYNELELVQRFS